MKKQTKKLIIALSISFVTVLLIFSITQSTSDSPMSEPKEEDVDIKELVTAYSMREITDSEASISSHELVISQSSDEEKTYDIEDEDFLISFAPYINETHPCAIHSLSGCQGELVDKDFDVLIEDEDGNVVVDQVMTSQTNGFIDVWMPRDTNYQITVKYDDKVASSTVSTFEGDNTCITTMQLV